ncbi:MAG: NAD-dependent epimerase/dehydratase family protein [Acetatifactor sp.]
MKKILITGAGSYIGVNVEKYLLKWPEEYQVNSINMIGEEWKKEDFSGYDVVFHVAGIAHIKETKENSHLYYDVNEHLAVAVAEKAKNEGVKQFIILSTMSVYGITVGHITKETLPNPINSYGKAKYNADLKIEKLDCPTFKVAILRPPMVYGKGCKGNYQTLRKFALKSPIFPYFKNERSMIYVGNLAEFVKNCIDEEKNGLFFPQDAEYVCTANMVKKIADSNRKRIMMTKLINWSIYLALGLNVNVFKKVFGSLTYEKIDLVEENDFEEAMRKTEV